MQSREAPMTPWPDKHIRFSFRRGAGRGRAPGPANIRTPCIRNLPRAGLILVLTALGLWQCGEGLWIYAKAQLAQRLLEQAWDEQRQTGQPVRPWPWADTWPVARLRLPQQGVTLLVLQGDSGRSLAFGPGMAAGSTPFGTTLISGHRDTHFAVLQQVRVGEVVELETLQGAQRFQVLDTQVFDSRQERISAREDEPELVLLTCYPFDALVPGGPLRYRVRAIPL